MTTVRILSEMIVDDLRIFDTLIDRVKRPSLPSKKKRRSESFIGYDFCHDRQKMVHKIRMYNRDTDEYLEIITDIETAEIIHECIEPFSEHVGHGTAKKK